MSKYREVYFSFDDVSVFAESIGVDYFLEIVKTLEQARINIANRKNKNYKTYLIRNNSNNLIKIGKSIDPVNRLNSLSIVSNDLELIHVINEDVETLLHYKYAKKNKFKEWFLLTKKDLKNIINGKY